MEDYGVLTIFELNFEPIRDILIIQKGYHR